MHQLFILGLHQHANSSVNQAQFSIPLCHLVTENLYETCCRLCSLRSRLSYGVEYRMFIKGSPWDQHQWKRKEAGLRSQALIQPCQPHGDL